MHVWKERREDIKKRKNTFNLNVFIPKNFKKNLSVCKKYLTKLKLSFNKKFFKMLFKYYENKWPKTFYLSYVIKHNQFYMPVVNQRKENYHVKSTYSNFSESIF